MKTIPLAQAFAILTDCAAVIVDNVVTYPSLVDLDGDDENEFLSISWQDDEGQEFNIKFTEGQNQQTTVSGSVLTLIDHEGDKHKSLFWRWLTLNRALVTNRAHSSP